MTCQRISGGKKSKTQRGKRTNKRKTQKGGFWPFTSSATSSATADPNAPKNPGFFASLFGSSKKPEAVEEVSNPIVNAPKPEAPVESEASGSAPAPAPAPDPAPVKGGKRRRNKKHKK